MSFGRWVLFHLGDGCYVIWEMGVISSGRCALPTGNKPYKLEDVPVVHFIDMFGWLAKQLLKYGWLSAHVWTSVR